ncbi:glycosyltransferase family 4 protein [Cronobacter dublinensis]|nr:glycosyltransferase family 4 protein [Cronobacter dublinensis]EKF2292725.1 glycosyltransferase family 4 protein [Cronobacter dublinensis]EKF2297846.1 glycosyltransferase family 4 protein [Cronobacter dublinensis]EKK5267323.1 glycosyltransferase family 4 protein [Cronobacter dublinensis]EKM0137401.1 glycosyltransferase family 4 protein [Cronobacter dublinensis]
MKLAIVRQTWNPNGGAERFVSRALNVLSQSGELDVTLIARQWESGAGWQTLTVDPPFRNRKAREAGFAAAAAAQFPAFDIVQSHERIPGATIFRAGDGVHAAWLEQYRRIQSPLARWAQSFSAYHNYILQAEREMFMHPALRKVICNSKMVRDDIVRRFGLADHQLTVIYNGVDTSVFHPSVREHSLRGELNIPVDAPVLAYVGSGFARKGVAVALQAIVDHPAVWLLVAGRDKHARRFEALARKLGVASRVKFLGPVSDIKTVYGSADALILPTLYDPFPNVCVEALACGLPLLTSHGCGAAEWVQEGENGWVRDALDAAGYRQAIGEWLAGRTAGKDYAAAARRTAEPWTLERMAQELNALYRELLA